MPIIALVGRRSLRVRTLIVGMYAFLILGSVTMIYPFIMMLASSISSEVDVKDHVPIPRYLYSDTALWAKYLDGKYFNWNFRDYQSKYGVDYRRFDQVEEIPEIELTPGLKRRLDDWQDFKRELPRRYKSVFWVDAWRGGKVQRLYQDYLKRKYKRIEFYNDKFGTKYDYFQGTDIVGEPQDRHKWRPMRTAVKEEWEDFKATLPTSFYRVFYPETLYHEHLERKFLGKIENLNERLGRNYSSFREIKLPHLPPQDEEEFKVWREFLRETWPLRFIELTGGEKEYQEFLKQKYETIELYNARAKEKLKSFAEASPSPTMPDEDFEFENWSEFVDGFLPGRFIRIISNRTLYENFLKKKYGDIESVNGAYGTKFVDLSEVEPPFIEDDVTEFLKKKWRLRLSFISSNYIKVYHFLILKSRSVLVTFLFVLATILTQLTVMPLAAYALSRFRLRYSHRILLFLLATMAFPPEVAMIPNYLLMKELHLLNTLWALILPGVANGFSIFILKGFFDSLPQELYEAATIEGASELRMFWNIAVPLSKPVLAVIAFWGFNVAYGSFMWALLICQDRKWWTLMVWLFQFQQTNPQYVVLAALIIAGIPTLLVFIFAQKIILRGIIIPTFQ